MHNNMAVKTDEFVNEMTLIPRQPRCMAVNNDFCE